MAEGGELTEVLSLMTQTHQDEVVAQPLVLGKLDGGSAARRLPPRLHAAYPPPLLPRRHCCWGCAAAADAHYLLSHHIAVSARKTGAVGVAKEEAAGARARAASRNSRQLTVVEMQQREG